MQVMASDIKFIESLKKQWLSMIDAIDDPLVILNKNFEIIRYNKSYWKNVSKNFDLPLDGLKNKKCFEVFANRKSPCLNCHLKPSSWTTETLFPNEIVEVTIHSIESDTDTKEGLFVVHYKFLTEQIHMRQSLSHADKLSALGRMASGVAHELNSPLAAILAFTQVLIEETESSDPHKEDLVQIEEGARRCKSIVEDMLHLAHFERNQKPSEAVDLKKVVQNILRFLEHPLRKAHVTVQLDLPDESPYVWGIPSQLEQVFLNMLSNAIYSMEKMGNGAIEISINKETDPQITIPLSKEGYWQIHISDSGEGINKEDLSKIFEPFYTTKPVGEGTGLGLSISYSLIKEHKGYIGVQSEKDQGTTFIITLPIYNESEKT
jgi:two-component system NtrC family sensor kinase